MSKLSVPENKRKFIILGVIVGILFLSAISLYLIVFSGSTTQPEFSVVELTENKSIVEKTNGSINGDLEFVVTSSDGNTYSTFYTQQEVENRSKFSIDTSKIASTQDITLISVFEAEGRERKKQLQVISINNIIE